MFCSDYLLSIGFNDVFEHTVDYLEEYGDSDYDGSYTDDMKQQNETGGTVFVLYDGLTGRICYDGEDDQDGDVACKEMGFLHGLFYNHYSDWITTYKADIMWSANFNCTKVNEDCSRTSDLATGFG